MDACQPRPIHFTLTAVFAMKLITRGEPQGMELTGTGQLPEESLTERRRKNQKDSLQPWAMTGQCAGNKGLSQQSGQVGLANAYMAGQEGTHRAARDPATPQWPFCASAF